MQYERYKVPSSYFSNARDTDVKANKLVLALVSLLHDTCARGFPERESKTLTDQSNPMTVDPMSTRNSIARCTIIVFTLMVMVFTISSCFASDISGKVINGTARRAAAGDDIILLDLSGETMNEQARTKTDNAGRFHLSVSDPGVTHVLRVIHEGVTYHRVVPGGADPVAIEVYDAAARLEGISAIMDVERFESIGDYLEVKQLVTMRNKSKPPRTLMKDRSFEVQLPPEAKMRYGLVQVGESQALKQKPIAGDQPGQYYFNFPLRPGDTRFAVVYQVPYEGQATIQPTIRNARERFVAMLPRSMKFEPTDPMAFHQMENTTPDNVQATDPVALEQSVSFHISGTGTLAELEGRSQGAGGSKATHTATIPKTGGGLGPPIGAPDPLEEYRGRIVGGLAIALLAGASLVVARGKTARGVNTAQTLTHNAPARGARSQIKSNTSARQTRYRNRSVAKACR